MLDHIIAFSIKNKLFIALLTIVLIVWGVWSASRLPIDAVPDITNNQVQIITTCPTLAGQEVEQLVTYPIEQSIANLPKLIELRSISRFGLSVITVVFEEDMDIYFARQLIHEKIKEATEKIPDGIGSPQLAPVSTGLGEIYQYIIHPTKEAESKYSAMELRTMQDWIVARQLYGTPGIAEVNSFGGQLKQYEVAINPDKLLAMQVTIPEIFSALECNNENTGGAYIDKKPNAYFIRGIGLIRSFEDIKNIVVKSNSNQIPILIKDVAEVSLGSATRYGALTYNGEKDAVGGIIMMLKGANSAEVIERIKEKMPSIQKSLPSDVLIEAFLDRTDLVNRAMNTVEKNLIEGALIVIFVLVLFLGNLRAGLIVASAIPLSMLFALGLMNVFKVSANLMSLGAIDFGLIVDGAVIIVESIFHRITHFPSFQKNKLSNEEMDTVVQQSASKMMNSATFGQIIILIVYLPILSLIGIEGKMFRPMAETVAFAILGALLLSITYIPMMSSMLLSKHTIHQRNISDRLMEYFQKIYTRLLVIVIKFKTGILLLSLSLFFLSVYLFLKMGGEFIPNLKEGDFAFHCILPQGSSLSQSMETSMQAMRLIKTFDEVKMVIGKTGTAEVPTNPMPPEATDMMIILKPPQDWKRKITYDELADEFMKKLSAIPGAFFEINQPIQMRFNELMTGIRQDVAVKIFGENLDTLLSYAQQVSSIVQSIPGVTEPMVEQVEGLPQITIKYNRHQIAHYGLNIKDINRIVSTAFAGGKAGVVYENERRFDLVVRAESKYRDDIDDLNHLYIPIPEGAQIPLSQVAEIKYEIGPAQISRENGQRRIVVGFNVRGRDIESVVKEIQLELTKSIKLPEGYYYRYGGTFENLKAASGRLMFAVPLALILIFILLYFTFRSIRQALLIYTAIPMSAIGGVLALLLRDMPFSISAGIGFIALFGVSVLNGIVLIGTFNELEKEGLEDKYERILKGTQLRLRPVLMTALVASFGFIPMALSHGAGAEVQKPLATVVIGGLISATFLTLFVLPLIYIIFSANRKIKMNTPLIILVALFIIPNFSNAQSVHRLSLEQAISMALDNNPELQSKKLNEQSSAVLKKSIYELPKSEWNLQYGQFNSIRNDAAFTVSQTIPFPKVFSARSALYESEISNTKIHSKETSNEVIFKVRSLYFTYQFLIHNQKRLESLDSNLIDYKKAAELKYTTGESSYLEYTIINSKIDQLRLQQNQNQSEIITTLTILKSILNTKDSIVLILPDQYEPLQQITSINKSRIENNPSLLALFQNIKIAENELKLQKAYHWPEFKFGYFNQSLIGIQNIDGSDQYFGSGKRFQGIHFGFNLPLSINSTASKFRSQEFKNKALLLEAEGVKLNLQAKLESAFQNYLLYLESYNYYRTKGLSYAEVLNDTSLKQYTAGEIGYMEYLQILQTSSEIYYNTLQSIDQLNQSITQINFLLNQ